MLKSAGLIRCSNLSVSLLKISTRKLSNLIDCNDQIKCKPILESLHYFEDFITDSEEKSLLDQVDKLLKRRRYEDSHFDYAIYQYREIEFKNWNETNANIIDRMKALGFAKDPSKFNLSSHSDTSHTYCDLIEKIRNKETDGNRLKPEPIDKQNEKFSNQFSNQFSKQTSSDEQSKQQSINRQFNEQINNLQTKRKEIEIVNNTSSVLNNLENSSITDKLNTHLDKGGSDIANRFRIIPEVHILDLSAKGAIKPHVDSVRFCGSRIIGLSLCSDAVMRLIRNDDKQTTVDILLKRKSLYVMRDFSRYDCTHEILGEEQSFFKNQKVPRDRRISIITRPLPDRDE